MAFLREKGGFFSHNFIIAPFAVIILSLFPSPHSSSLLNTQPRSLTSEGERNIKMDKREGDYKRDKRNAINLFLFVLGADNNLKLIIKVTHKFCDTEIYKYLIWEQSGVWVV